MSNLIKKSWTDSRQEVWYKANHKRAEQTYKGVSNAAELAFIKGDDIQGWCCLILFYFFFKAKVKVPRYQSSFYLVQYVLINENNKGSKTSGSFLSKI